LFVVLDVYFRSLDPEKKSCKYHFGFAFCCCVSVKL